MFICLFSSQKGFKHHKIIIRILQSSGFFFVIRTYCCEWFSHCLPLLTLLIALLINKTTSWIFQGSFRKRQDSWFVRAEWEPLIDRKKVHHNHVLTRKGVCNHGGVRKVNSRRGNLSDSDRRVWPPPTDAKSASFIQLTMETVVLRALKKIRPRFRHAESSGPSNKST
jgi:hypothetical protein